MRNETPADPITGLADDAADTLRARWDGAMRAYLAANRASDDYELTHGADDSEYDAATADALYEALSDAAAVLIAMPAPDAAAIAWKADYLFLPDGRDDSSPCWSMDYVRPFLSDIHRLAAVA